MVVKCRRTFTEHQSWVAYDWSISIICCMFLDMFFDLTFILAYVFVILSTLTSFLSWMLYRKASIWTLSHLTLIVLTCFLSWMLYGKASIWTLPHRLKKTKGWSSRHDATMIAKKWGFIYKKKVPCKNLGLWPRAYGPHSGCVPCRLCSLGL